MKCDILDKIHFRRRSMKSGKGRKKSNTAATLLMLLLAAALAVVVILRVGPEVSGPLMSVLGHNTGTAAVSEQFAEASKPSPAATQTEKPAVQESVPDANPEPETGNALEDTPEGQITEEADKESAAQESISEEATSMSNETETVETEPVETEPDPGIFGDAGISITALYPSSEPICNTDGDGSICTNLAVLEVMNASQMHITSALVNITTTEGKNLYFTIYEIPAGYSVRAYDVNGTSISANDEIASVSCQPRLRNRTRLVANKIKVQSEGTKVTVKTLTIDYLYNMTFYFHELAPGETGVLLGGTTYSETIEAMYPGQVVEFYLHGCDADEIVLCYVYPGYDG